MTGPDLTLLALHGLRLTGVAEAGAVAEVVGADTTLVEVELKELANHDLVVRRDRPPRPGWLLTPAGAAEADRLLAAELAARDARGAVRSAYDRFCPLNRDLLDICSRWQVRGGVVNDHHDPAYDGAVVADLGRLDDRAQPVLADLASALERFAPYGPRLAAARRRVDEGDTDHITGPLIASYHTVWFELHEDLLATLGLDRASETQRLSLI